MMNRSGAWPGIEEDATPPSLFSVLEEANTEEEKEREERIAIMRGQAASEKAQETTRLLQQAFTSSTQASSASQPEPSFAAGGLFPRPRSSNLQSWSTTSGSSLFGSASSSIAALTSAIDPMWSIEDVLRAQSLQLLVTSPWASLAPAPLVREESSFAELLRIRQEQTLIPTSIDAPPIIPSDRKRSIDSKPPAAKRPREEHVDHKFPLPLETHTRELPPPMLVSYRRLWGKLEKAPAGVRLEIFRRRVQQGRVPLLNRKQVAFV